MSGENYEGELRRLARVLSEIAHTLEAIEHPRARVERTMTLLRQVVPYGRCAVLEVGDDGATVLHVVPAQDDEQRRELAATMLRLFELVSTAEHGSRARDPIPSLSLPLIGLDSALGLIRVEPDGTTYDATHLRVLAVVAAQLGAYLMTLRLRTRDRERERELAAAHDFQRLLAGIVSHDLRNPLAVISMVASSLLERASDEKQAEALRRALRNAEHAARLIGDLADVTEARVSGTISLAPRREPVAALVTTIVDDLRHAHPSSTIELASSLAPDAEVEWDVERVTQVVSNLVTNALAHGAVGLPVRVSARTAADGVVVEVHNYGAPIAPELLPALFNPFIHGAERPRPRNIRGLGLGLFIVDQIVRAHGGTVAVASDELAGTTFTVALPQTCAGQRAALDTEPAPDTEPALAAPPLVMVVDDDEDVRFGMTAILEKRGFRVVTATDGLDAWERLQGGARPRLILLDLQMPRMNGEELCERLQGDPALASIPVVLISSDTASALRLSRERARAYLAKPVSMEQLLATIAAIG